MERKRFSVAERIYIFDMFNGHCAYCGCELGDVRKMQIDHKKSLKRGGTNEISNLYPSCKSCNKYKDTMTIERFRKALEAMPDVLTCDSVTYRIASRYGLVKIGEPKVVFYFERVKANETDI